LALTFSIKTRQQRHDDGDGGFVVGAKYACAITDDDVFTNPVEDFWVFRHPQPDILLPVETKIFSLKPQYLRTDDWRQADIDGIEMGNEADRRCVGPVATPDSGDDRMLIDNDIVETKAAHLLAKQAGKICLSR